MEITFIQLTKEELASLITDAVRAAMSIDQVVEPTKPFIKGIHELAEFLKVSPPRAQKLKNEDVFPYFQDGRTILFDPNKVKIAMEEYNQKRWHSKKNKLK